MYNSSAIHRDAFNQKFPGQLPKDAQWASKGHQGPSTTPKEASNTRFSGQLPTDAQWRPQTPASQPSRDVFNVQLPADNRTRPQAISRGPPTQRAVFNEAFIGQLPSDCPQDALGRMAPPTYTPRKVFNQGFVSQLPTDIRLRPQTACRGRPPSATLRVGFNHGFVGQLPSDGQWENRVNRQQVRDPYPGRDVFVGQLPTDRQPQPPRERKPPTTNYYQSRSKPLCGAMLGQHPINYQNSRTIREKPRDPFNEALFGQPPTDYQGSRDPFDEAFIGQLDNQSKRLPLCLQSKSLPTPRDVFNTGFSGQLPRDSRWSAQPTAEGKTALPLSTPRDVFN
nr:unnamed protein product [Callosobruchus chinensis]